MKTLIENYSPSYCSKVVKHTMDGKDVRFKIVAESDKCYYRLSIFIQTLNNDFVKVAMEDDIPGYIYVNYVSKDNIKAAEDYIEKVF